ncbi:hypothetical protein Ciccas_012116 [Cichlidogyrus casuarinus]|uniref:Uncharacterized protein n=1 Tax=Cichlidogyrus casuarinus TaxID=1844966 RepID=A0ABD2PPB0_9PLAT
MVVCLAAVSYLCGPWPVLVVSNKQTNSQVNILQPTKTKDRLLNATLNLVPLLYTASIFCSALLLLGFFRTVLSLHRAANVLFIGICLLTLALTQFGLLIPRMDSECNELDFKSLRSRILCRLCVLVPLAKFKSL